MFFLIKSAVVAVSVGAIIIGIVFSIDAYYYDMRLLAHLVQHYM